MLYSLCHRSCSFSGLIAGNEGPILLLEYLAIVIQCASIICMHVIIPYAMALVQSFRDYLMPLLGNRSVIDWRKLVGVLGAYTLLNFHYTGVNLDDVPPPTMTPTVSLVSPRKAQQISPWDYFRGITIRYDPILLNHCLSIFRFCILGRYLMLVSRIGIYALVCDRIQQQQEYPPSLAHPPIFENLTLETDFQIAIFSAYSILLWFFMISPVVAVILRWLSVLFVIIEYLNLFDILDLLPWGIFNCFIYVFRWIESVSKKMGN